MRRPCVLLLAIALPLAGCVEYDEVLTIAADGSGSMSVDLTLDLAFVEKLHKLAGDAETEDSDTYRVMVSKEEIQKQCRAEGIAIKSIATDEPGPKKTHVKLDFDFKSLAALRSIAGFSDRELEFAIKDEQVDVTYR